MRERAGARAGRKMHQANRLAGPAAARTCDAGDGDHEIGFCLAERAARHGLGGFAADGAVLAQDVRRHAQHLLLGRVRIGDEAAIEHVGRAGDLGERARHQAAGAGFGGGDFPAAGAGSRQHGDGGGEQRLAHGEPHGSRTVAVA